MNDHDESNEATDRSPQQINGLMAERDILESTEFSYAGSFT
jgi:hypothetical protein